MSKQSQRNVYAVPVTPLSYMVTGYHPEYKRPQPKSEAPSTMGELEDIINAAMSRIRSLDNSPVAESVEGDPLDRLTSLSESMGIYDDVGANENVSQRDPLRIGYANINVSIEGGEWYAKDLLSVLEATILDTIQEYKETSHGARTLKTTVGTNTHSSQ